jgi:hypothetical protein
MRNTQTPPYNFLGLPWHRAYQADETLLTPDQPVKLVIDMMPTSYVFKAGHRIRLAVTNSLGLVMVKQFSPAPQASIYRNIKHTSFVTLPVVTKPSAFTGTAKINTNSINYEGTAELYTSSTAVYLQCGDKWLSWETTRSWILGTIERFKCEGETGDLSVVVRHYESAPFDVKATGDGVEFQGDAKY